MYNFLNASSLGSDPGLNITDGGMINGSKQEFDRIYKFEINLINLRYSILKTKAKPDSKPVSNSFFQISNEFMGVIKLMDMSGMNGIYFEGL